MSTKNLIKIMTLAPSTNVVFPDKSLVIAEGIFLCASHMKIEGHRTDPWEVPHINLLPLVKKFCFSLDDFI
jgi:hypothetical protein